MLNALHLWADLTTLLATLDVNNNIIQRYNYTDSRVPTSMQQDGETYYLHYDQVGTPKAISDTNHNIVKEITYDTYGNIQNDTNPSFKVPFGFAGGLQDQDTQLVHFGYRELDTYTGKWTTKDPIDFSGGDSNLYGYVLQDPVNLVDPTGLVDMSFVPNDSLMNRYLNYTMNTYNPSNAFSIAAHGYQGALIGDLYKISDAAQQSGKSQILLVVCQQGEGEYGNDAQKLANMSGLPVEYTSGNVSALPFIGPMTFYPHTWEIAYPQK